ncbi:glutaredoxin family protein [Methylocystis sp. L43]|uniref:glutaredoxin domain-containing protein n=1 Tax=unclassified Methylocystis TaxID=2625913 RepID=UPI0018C347A5|nr:MULTISPECIES: glutaredoxin domain-containing protein [unclassified Methylocystis]MBG0797468.1 glutaredoxin family protein [Methylocystis sp. L43]MBG0805073.1 glutaredoxin family protein [Methylocystis sp. H15]
MKLPHFRVALAVLLGLAFAWLQFAEPASPPPAQIDWREDGQLHVFFSPDCPHCHEAIEFLKQRRKTAYVLHDISKSSSEALFRRVVKHYGIEDPAVPLFVRGSRYVIGFDTAQTTGREILALLSGQETVARRAAESKITIPLIGEVDPTHHSLLALTALMGLSDGFNPCAMWVLIYLISLIVNIQDRQKIWWLVGTFVLASGVLYFLFMTAWLNTFLFIGYIRPLTQLIALTAIGFGLDHLIGVAAARGEVVCEVGDMEQRQRTMQWGRKIVAAPVGIASLVMVIALAFAVNAIEFICSAALPAIYTHLLALTDLPIALHYAYIGLYVAFFMLDDLIIFGLAAFAVQKIVNTRYAAISRLIGGVVLIGLGGWMLAR